MTMEEARSYCLKLERDRERSWRESAQGKFEASHQSLDRLIDTFEDPSEIAVFSDGGAGEEQIVSACDGDAARCQASVKHAMNRLRRRPELKKTLSLIIKNGSNREKSIWSLMTSRNRPNG